MPRAAIVVEQGIYVHLPTISSLDTTRTQPFTAHCQLIDLPCFLVQSRPNSSNFT